MDNYKCFVAKIDKTIPIEKADNIHIALVMGEQVIVSKNWTEGKEGLFFTSDTQLSPEFLSYNNLYRNKEKNKDKEKSGFFEDNGRVRCQPFLGVKSEGFFCEKEALVWCGENQYMDLNVGDQFNELNGFPVCKKYLNEKTLKKLNSNNNKKKTKIVETPMFHKHVDTAQFKHLVDKIEKGDILSFHSKRHGCFHHASKVRMYDGTTKEIKDIKIGDTVVGFDEDNNLKPAKVLNTFDNGKDGQWLKITYDRIEDVKGNSFYIHKVTEDHEIRTKRGYVKAKELVVGDTVLASHPSYVYSDDQIAALIGMHLGDGYLSGSYNMQFCHKLDHEDYLTYKQNLFSSMGVLDRTYKTSGYGSKVVFSMLKSCLHQRHLFKNVKGNNEVSDWMIEKATPLTLAIIYMDDGCLFHSDKQKDRAGIACCSIPDDDMSNFLKLFHKFDIYPVHFKDSKGFNRLRLNTKDAYLFWDLIKGYIPDVMKYKFPEGYDFPDLVDIQQGYHGHVLTETKVTNIEDLGKRKHTKYDIMTETSNYVVSNILVHNSSQRGSYSKVLRSPKTIMDKLKDKVGIFQRESWEYLVGTRNVTLYSDQYNKQGFHGSEQWRFDIMEIIKPHLEKGMTIYLEVFGYANGKPIMGKHNMSKLKDKAYKKKYGNEITYKYGCPENTCNYHIYRITYVNEQGNELDFTNAQLIKWCEYRGLNPTLEVHPTFIYDGDKEKLTSLVENLTERPDCLTEDYTDPSHISEGIIIRVDRGTQIPLFLKSKSFAFKVCEGIAKENNEVDLEEIS